MRGEVFVFVLAVAIANTVRVPISWNDDPRTVTDVLEDADRRSRPHHLKAAYGYTDNSAGFNKYGLIAPKKYKGKEGKKDYNPKHQGVNKDKKEVYSNFESHAQKYQHFQNHPNINLQIHPNVNFQNQPNVNFQNHPNVNFQNHPNVNFQSHPNVNFQNHPKVNFQNHPNVNFQNQVSNFNGYQKPSINNNPSITNTDLNLEKQLRNINEEQTFQKHTNDNLQKNLRMDANLRNHLNSGEKLPSETTKNPNFHKDLRSNNENIKPASIYHKHLGDGKEIHQSETTENEGSNFHTHSGSRNKNINTAPDYQKHLGDGEEKRPSEIINFHKHLKSNNGNKNAAAIYHLGDGIWSQNINGKQNFNFQTSHLDSPWVPKTAPTDDVFAKIAENSKNVNPQHDKQIHSDEFPRHFLQKQTIWTPGNVQGNLQYQKSKQINNADDGIINNQRKNYIYGNLAMTQTDNTREEQNDEEEEESAASRLMHPAKHNQDNEEETAPNEPTGDLKNNEESTDTFQEQDEEAEEEDNNQYRSIHPVIHHGYVIKNKHKEGNTRYKSAHPATHYEDVEDEQNEERNTQHKSVYPKVYHHTQEQQNGNTKHSSSYPKVLHQQNDEEDTRNLKHPIVEQYEEEDKIPTRPIYPGEGIWAIPGKKHQPYIRKLKAPIALPDDEESKISPEGRSFFEAQSQQYDRQSDTFPESFDKFKTDNNFNNPKLENKAKPIPDPAQSFKVEDIFRNSQNSRYKPIINNTEETSTRKYTEDDESEKDDDDSEEDHFVPTRLYTQVRKYETEKHVPESVLEPRLREVVKNSRIHTVYNEEGYEDSGYDHAGHEKNAENSEGYQEGNPKLIKPDSDGAASSYAEEEEPKPKDSFKGTAVYTKMEMKKSAPTEYAVATNMKTKLKPKTKPNISYEKKVLKDDEDTGRTIMSDIEKHLINHERRKRDEVIRNFVNNRRHRSIGYLSDKQNFIGDRRKRLIDKNQEIQTRNKNRRNKRSLDLEQGTQSFNYSDRRKISLDQNRNYVSTPKRRKRSLDQQDDIQNLNDFGRIDRGQMFIEHKRRKRSHHKIKNFNDNHLRTKRFTNYFPKIDVDTSFLKLTQFEETEQEKEDRYPYYNANQKKLNRHSPLRYAQDLKNIPVKVGGELSFYKQADRIECAEVQDSVNPIPKRIENASEDGVEEGDDGEVEGPRLTKLGDKIDCFKVKYFGDDPLDSPFFGEGKVEQPEPIFGELKPKGKKLKDLNEEPEINFEIDYLKSFERKQRKQVPNVALEVVDLNQGKDNTQNSKKDEKKEQIQNVGLDIFDGREEQKPFVEANLKYFNGNPEKEQKQQIGLDLHQLKINGTNQENQEISKAGLDLNKFNIKQRKEQNPNIDSQLENLKNLDGNKNIEENKNTGSFDINSRREQIEFLRKEQKPIVDGDNDNLKIFSGNQGKQQKPNVGLKLDHLRFDLTERKILENIQKANDFLKNHAQETAKASSKNTLGIDNKFQKISEDKTAQESRIDYQKIQFPDSGSENQDLRSDLKRDTKGDVDSSKDASLLTLNAENVLLKSISSHAEIPPIPMYKNIDSESSNPRQESMNQYPDLKPSSESQLYESKTNSYNHDDDGDSYLKAAADSKDNNFQNSSNLNDIKLPNLSSIDVDPDYINDQTFASSTDYEYQSDTDRQTKMLNFSSDNPRDLNYMEYEYEDVDESPPTLSTLKDDNNGTNALPETQALKVRILKRRKRPHKFNMMRRNNRYVPALNLNLNPPPPPPETNDLNPKPVKQKRPKPLSEVFYKDEIKPDEQLNVLTDVINNIKNSSRDMVWEKENRKPLKFPNADHKRIVFKPSEDIRATFYQTSTERPARRKPMIFEPTESESVNEYQYKKVPVYKMSNQVLKNFMKNPNGGKLMMHLNNQPIPVRLKVKDDKTHMNTYFVEGMKPPLPEKPYIYSDYSLKGMNVRRMMHKSGGRRKRSSSDQRPGYSPFSRQGMVHKEEEEVEEEEDDDYVPHRPMNFHYDPETRRIVYHDKPSTTTSAPEYVEVEYDDVEEATHPPKKVTSPRTVFHKDVLNPENGPTLVDFLSKLHSDPSYKFIPDPETTKVPATITTTVSPGKTTPPEFLKFLEMLHKSEGYVKIEDETEKPKKVPTTTEAVIVEEVVEEEEEETLPVNVQNSPGGQFNSNNPLQLFDISEYLPKTKNYSPRTSIDYSKYKTIERPTSKPKVEDDENVEEEKVESNRRNYSEGEQETKSTEISRKTFEHPIDDDDNKTDKDSTLKYKTISRNKVRPVEDDEEVTTARTTTTTEEIKVTTRAPVRGRKRPTTRKPTSTTRRSVPSTTTEESIQVYTPATHRPASRVYPRRQRPKIRLRTTTPTLENDDDDEAIRKTRRTLRKLNETEAKIPPNHKEVYTPIIVEDKIEADTEIIETQKQPRLVTPDIIRYNRTEITDPGKINPRKLDVEVFKQYNTRQRHGGNYIRENSKRRRTTTPKPTTTSTTLPSEVNDSKDKEYDYEEKDEVKIMFDTDVKEGEDASEDKKKIVIIKDPSKRLYFYAPVK